MEISQVAFGINPHQLPEFTVQAIDDERCGLITSMTDTEYGFGSDTSISGNRTTVTTITEQEALTQTILLVEEAMTHPKIPANIARQAEDVYENLSFVGEKELAEATRSIAEYWKACLDDSPEVSIFIVTSKTFEPEDIETEIEAMPDQELELGYVSDNKSDEYILDRVLGNFSDEDLQRYSGRLLLSAAELAGQEQQATKVIVLDDWIMSGQQIQDTLDGVHEHLPSASVEINLVACNEDRLARGIIHDQASSPIPVKAHFVSRRAAHPYAAEFGGAYLTASHSSGDYPFEGTMEAIVEALNQVRPPSDIVYMPPLANIVRPYYSPDYHFQHIKRLASFRSIGRQALLNAA